MTHMVVHLASNLTSAALPLDYALATLQAGRVWTGGSKSWRATFWRFGSCLNRKPQASSVFGYRICLGGQYEDPATSTQ